MSTTTKSPQSDKRPQRSPVEAWPRWVDDEKDRQDLYVSISAGIVATVLIHVALFLLIPWDHLEMAVETDPREQPPPMDVEFLTPEQALPRFVEVNPNVMPERPKDTDNIAAQDQVAAQEDPDPLGSSDTPLVDGEQSDSPKIVEGSMEEIPPPVPEGVMAPETMPTPPIPEQEPSPEPQVEAPEVQEAVEASKEEAAPEAVEQAPKIEEEGIISREEVVEMVAPEPVEQTVEEKPAYDPQKVVLEEVMPQNAVQAGEPVPQARPSLSYRVPSGPLVKNANATNRMGNVAVDANFSEFGAYQQRMIEAISAQWHLLGNQSRYTGADRGTHVVVEFTLDRSGVARDVRVLYTNSSTPGAIMTTDAIKSRSPYGIWTQDMIRVLGESQTVRITFHYR